MILQNEHTDVAVLQCLPTYSHDKSFQVCIASDGKLSGSVGTRLWQQ